MQRGTCTAQQPAQLAPGGRAADLDIAPGHAAQDAAQLVISDEIKVSERPVERRFDVVGIAAENIVDADLAETDANTAGPHRAIEHPGTDTRKAEHNLMIEDHPLDDSERVAVIDIDALKLHSCVSGDDPGVLFLVVPGIVGAGYESVPCLARPLRTGAATVERRNAAGDSARIEPAALLDPNGRVGAQA